MPCPTYGTDFTTIHPLSCLCRMLRASRGRKTCKQRTCLTRWADGWLCGAWAGHHMSFVHTALSSSPSQSSPICLSYLACLSVCITCLPLAWYQEWYLQDIKACKSQGAGESGASKTETVRSRSVRMVQMTLWPACPQVSGEVLEALKAGSHVAGNGGLLVTFVSHRFCMLSLSGAQSCPGRLAHCASPIFATHSLVIHIWPGKQWDCVMTACRLQDCKN